MSLVQSVIARPSGSLIPCSLVDEYSDFSYKIPQC
jgi:hypothetical protein